MVPDPNSRARLRIVSRQHRTIRRPAVARGHSARSDRGGHAAASADRTAEFGQSDGAEGKGGGRSSHLGDVGGALALRLERARSTKDSRKWLENTEDRR